MDVVSIVDNGPIDRRFNVVVVGDGFTSTDLPEYDRRVRILFGLPVPGVPAGIDLGHMEPFASVMGLINVWSVRTESQESGITVPVCTHASCQSPCVKHTYYRVKGCFRGNPYPGYVGIEHADVARVFDAVACAVPIEHAHLIMLIANYAKYGGSAFPEKRMAFATMDDGNDLAAWVQLVAHECGHAIAHVAEEDIRCVSHDSAKNYPNQDDLAAVHSNTVKWKPQAKASELAGGRFMAIHRLGDPIDQNPYHGSMYGQPIMSPGLYGRLGAFWGCQDVDAVPAAPPPTGCDRFGESRGGNFFRPTAECRMRKLKYAFCRVCSKSIKDRIEDVCV